MREILADLERWHRQGRSVALARVIDLEAPPLRGMFRSLPATNSWQGSRRIPVARSLSSPPGRRGRSSRLPCSLVGGSLTHAGAAGFWAIWLTHERSLFRFHFQTLHSWVGVVVLALYVLQWLSGLLVFYGLRSPASRAGLSCSLTSTSVCWSAMAAP